MFARMLMISNKTLTLHNVLRLRVHFPLYINVQLSRLDLHANQRMPHWVSYCQSLLGLFLFFVYLVANAIFVLRVIGICLIFGIRHGVVRFTRALHILIFDVNVVEQILITLF